MDKQILRWGIVSTAAINRALIPPLQSSKRNTLAAVASRDLDKAQAYAREKGIPRAFGSYEAMLADPDVDAVYISLPNSLHLPWTLAAARAGKHVLCEKPIALTVDEVDQMARAAEENGVVIAEAFMYRHHPQTLKVKELLDAGAIGPLRQVYGAFSFYLDRPENVRMIPELGGGSIWDVGCYPISYARAMIGAEPAEVFGWQLTGETGIDVGFTGQMRFPGEIYFQFDCGFQHANRQAMEFIGEHGIISVKDPFTPRKGASITVTHDDGKQVKIPAPPKLDLYIGEVEDLYDAAVYGKPQRVTLADSRANVAAMVASLRSAATGAPQKV
jgi:predicted dehydrogenase